MVRLYRKKSPTTGRMLKKWYCFFRVPGPDGSLLQVHRCTGETTKTEAFKKAMELRRDKLAEAGAGELVARLRQTVEDACKVLEGLDPEALGTPCRIQGFETTRYLGAEFDDGLFVVDAGPHGSCTFDIDFPT